MEFSKNHETFVAYRGNLLKIASFTANLRGVQINGLFGPEKVKMFTFPRARELFKSFRY